MRHVDIWQFFLRDLKEDNIVRTNWIPTADNSADLFRRNLFGPLFEKYIRSYVGFDNYMEYESNDNDDSVDWTLVSDYTSNRFLI
jgi:hypothetical protein